MATDYDAPRRTEPDEAAEGPLGEFTSHRVGARQPVVEADEFDIAESFELPGADLSGEELTVPVVPRRADEFTCSVCFLIQHRTRLALRAGDRPVCADCA